MRVKLQAIKQELRRRMHQSIPEQGRWLKQVVTGLLQLSRGADKTWSDADCVSFPRHQPMATHASAAKSEGLDDCKERTAAVGQRLAPKTANPSPLAGCALCSQTPKVGAVCPNWARTALCGGREVTRVPTAIQGHSRLSSVRQCVTGYWTPTSDCSSTKSASNGWFASWNIGSAHRRYIRLIQKWRKVGILEEGVVTVSERGTGQGAVISPLLANVYLHYVLDLWAGRWRRREATGDMIIVRYADDFIVGFQHEGRPTLPRYDA